MIRVALAAALVLAVVVLPRNAVAEGTLADYRQTFDTELGKIAGEETEALAALMQAYGAAVEALVAKAQANGELNTLLAAKKEQGRLKEEKTAPDATPAAAPDALNALRMHYHDAARKVQATRQSKTTALATKYIAALDGLVRTLTKAGNLKEAVAAKDEKRRAEFILADSEPVLRDASPAPAVPPPPQASGPVRLPEGLRKDLLLYHDFNALNLHKVNDQSGGRNHGVVHDAKWVRDGRGPANGVLVFDGQTSYVDLGDILNDVDLPITVSLWLNAAAIPKNWGDGMVFESDRREKVYSGFWVGIGKDRGFSITFGTGGAPAPESRLTFVAQGVVREGEWMHFIAVRDKDGATALYLNGEKARTEKQGSAEVKTVVHNAEPAVIGRLFEGTLDDLMVWKRALTEAEVQQVFALTRVEGTLAKTPQKPPSEPIRSGMKITFVQEKSMKLWPKGYKQMQFPQQETEDATGPFEGKPVYFDQRTGQDVVYEVRCLKPVKSVNWKGAAMKNMTLEVFDMDGDRVAQGGPYEGGNRWGEFKVEFEPRRDFVLKVSNHVSTWLLIDTLTLE